jgi:hypothetical protein
MCLTRILVQSQCYKAFKSSSGVFLLYQSSSFNMTSTAVPAYFELSWSILSSIGLLNVLFGLLVVGTTSLSPISIVPIVVSTACAIANGMCYYAFYADYSQNPTVVAGAVADVMWLVSSY